MHTYFFQEFKLRRETCTNSVMELSPSESIQISNVFVV